MNDMDDVCYSGSKETEITPGFLRISKAQGRISEGSGIKNRPLRMSKIKMSKSEKINLIIRLSLMTTKVRRVIGVLEDSE